MAIYMIPAVKAHRRRPPAAVLQSLSLVVLLYFLPTRWVFPRTLSFLVLHHLVIFIYVIFLMIVLRHRIMFVFVTFALLVLRYPTFFCGPFICGMLCFTLLFCPLYLIIFVAFLSSLWVAMFFLFCQNKKSEVATKQAEADRLTAEIGSHEARNQGGGPSLRGEYKTLEKAVVAQRRERENLQQDLEISNMNPKEVRMSYFVMAYTTACEVAVGAGGLGCPQCCASLMSCFGPS